MGINPNGIVVDGVMKNEHTIDVYHVWRGKPYWDIYFLTYQDYVYFFVRREWIDGAWTVTSRYAIPPEDQTKMDGTQRPRTREGQLRHDIRNGRYREILPTHPNYEAIKAVMDQMRKEADL